MRRGQNFSIDFSFPVHFTRWVFSPQNLTFSSTVRRLEPKKRHRVFFLIDSNVAVRQPRLVDDIYAYMNAFPEHLQMAGNPRIVQGGEASKNDLTHVLDLLEEMNSRSMDRQSFVTVIGGGAVLDAACFAAAIAHRGIRAIRVPTTVLAQADSAVGVKNGINLFGKKNFIGTFVPPFAVINDIEFIETLAQRDKIAGVAECVKVSLLRDPAFFEYLEENADLIAKADHRDLEYAIRRSAELHMRHIGESGDPFELGSSRPLDFGHWAAHKLESMTGHALRHGEAVAIGIALDVTYAMKKQFLSGRSAERILNLLKTLGFDLWADALDEVDEEGMRVILTGLQEFREHLGGELHITLLRDIGQPFDVHEMNDALILESIDMLRRRFKPRLQEVVRAVAVKSADRIQAL